MKFILELTFGKGQLTYMGIYPPTPDFLKLIAKKRNKLIRKFNALDQA